MVRAMPVRSLRTPRLIPPLGRALAALVASLFVTSGTAFAQADLPGRDAESLLSITRERNRKGGRWGMKSVTARPAMEPVSFLVIRGLP